MRLSRQQIADNEAKIRAAMTRLLNGGIPPGGKCDIKTLAREAGVDRTAFYGSRPYAHLRTEFEQRLSELLHTGERPDPRDAQVTWLKDEITRLKERLARSDATISELADFRSQAIARLAGTPGAGKPLIGMCDSARCPQATHHPCHRPVWAGHAENTKTFLGQLGRAQKTERARLQAEYDRAVRVLEQIDGAAAAGEPE